VLWTLKLDEPDRLKLGLPENLEFDDGTLSVWEAREIRKRTGLRVLPFWEAMSEMDVEAVICVIWLASQRIGKDLAYAGIEFDVAKMDLLTEDETKRKREADAAAVEEAQRSGNPTLDHTVLVNPT